LKRILVTGGTGFVGANLVRRLHQLGHEVHLIVRPGSDTWRLASLVRAFNIHTAALEDAESIRRIVRQVKPSWIFHAAAYGGYAAHRDLYQMIATNFMATVHLVQASLEVGCEAFINTGSSSEYGFRDHPPTESEALEPNSHYAVTKAAASLFCRYTAQTERVCIRTLRLYSVYGPYEPPTRLIPTLLLKARRGTYPPLVAPNVARDFIYVDDVVNAYLLAVRHPTRHPDGIYNVGMGVQSSLKQVVDLTRKLLHVRAVPRWGEMKNRSWDTAVWVANTNLSRRELGWAPKVSLRKGLQLTLEWFESNPDVLKRYEKEQRAAKRS